MDIAREEGSLSELVGRLSQDMTLLVRQEVQLARVELGGILARAIRDSVSLAGAGLVGYAVCSRWSRGSCWCWYRSPVFPPGSPPSWSAPRSA